MAPLSNSTSPLVVTPRHVPNTWYHQKLSSFQCIPKTKPFSFDWLTDWQTAGRQLSALRRLSFYLDSKAKLALFRAFILSHFKYCSAVWYHYSAPNTRCMEKIQGRALKGVYYNHTASYESLLNKARCHLWKLGDK